MAGTSRSSRNPFEGVTDFFSELSRMREIGARGYEAGHEHLERTHASAWVPTTDIFAQGRDLVIRVELAGVDPEDIDLRFTNGVLAVTGARRLELAEGEEVTFYVRERIYGEFRRTVSLPEGTQRSQITAHFDDGLVEITVRDGVSSSESTKIELADRSGSATTRGVD